MNNLLARCIVIYAAAAWPVCSQILSPPTTVPPATVGYSQAREALSHITYVQRRDPWQKSDQVVTSLHLARTEVVAELGGQAGYFARRMAKLAARVYVIDEQPAVLYWSRIEPPDNMLALNWSRGSFPLVAQSVDVIFFHDLLTTVNDITSYLGEITKALKPKGRIYILEFTKTTKTLSPALQLTRLTSELQALGFVQTEDYPFLDKQVLQGFTHR